MDKSVGDQHNLNHVMFNSLDGGPHAFLVIWNCARCTYPQARFCGSAALMRAANGLNTCVNQLISSELRARLLANGARSAREEGHDPLPVVKLFVPGSAAIWLLTELDPDDHDWAYGLYDLGLGTPQLDHIRLTDLAALEGEPVQVDFGFVAQTPLSEYWAYAKAHGSIQVQS